MKSSGNVFADLGFDAEEAARLKIHHWFADEYPHQARA